MADRTPAKQVAAALAEIRAVFAEMADYHQRHNPRCGCETVEVATETAERILAALEGRSARPRWWEILDASDPTGDARAHVRIDRGTIECVLLDHVDKLDDRKGRVDANLAELAYVYRELTGWDAKTEARRG